MSGFGYGRRMKRGRPKKPLEISAEQRETLEAVARRRKAGVAEVTRAKMVLACAEGRPNSEVAKMFGVSQPTVGLWRERFRLQGLEGLGDLPRAGAPRTVGDEQVAAIVRRTLQTKPKSATHWSTRTLAKETGVSHQTINRIWHAFGLQPHRHFIPSYSPPGSIRSKASSLNSPASASSAKVS
jgi:transposase